MDKQDLSRLQMGAFNLRLAGAFYATRVKIETLRLRFLKMKAEQNRRKRMVAKLRAFGALK